MPIGDGLKANRVSYNCSYIPEEIIIAAGLKPTRLQPAANPSLSDSHLHPNTCGLIKNLFASALNNNIDSTAFIFANSCDGMRKMYDTWKEYISAPLPLFLDIPKKTDPDSINYFACELKRLIAELEKLPGASEVTIERLNTAIQNRNNYRRQIKEVFDLQKDLNNHLSPRKLFDFLLHASNGEVDLDSKKIDYFSALNESASRGPRVAVAGNAIDKPNIFGLIEDLGAEITAIDTCIGLRHYDTPIKEDATDPVHAIAERYLGKLSCPRMNNFEDRTRRLKSLAAESHADGFIYCAVKHCDCGGFDAPMTAARFAEDGIPFLFIENDYVWSGIEQTRTKLQAFFEIIGREAARSC